MVRVGVFGCQVECLVFAWLSVGVVEMSICGWLLGWVFSCYVVECLVDLCLGA